MCNDKTKTTRKKGADTDSSLCHGCGKVPCVDDDFKRPSCKHNFCNCTSVTCECSATATQNCVPTAMSKSVLTAVVETLVALNGRLVGYAKKKPVDIVLNMTA